MGTYYTVDKSGKKTYISGPRAEKLRRAQQKAAAQTRSFTLADIATWGKDYSKTMTWEQYAAAAGISESQYERLASDSKAQIEAAKKAASRASSLGPKVYTTEGEKVPLSVQQGAPMRSAQKPTLQQEMTSIYGDIKSFDHPVYGRVLVKSDTEGVIYGPPRVPSKKKPKKEDETAIGMQQMIDISKLPQPSQVTVNEFTSPFAAGEDVFEKMNAMTSFKTPEQRRAEERSEILFNYGGEPSTMAGFFTEPPKPKQYYEAIYGPAAGPFIQFSRVSATTAAAGAKVWEIPNAGEGNAMIQSVADAAVHDPVAFAGMIAGMGFVTAVSGKVPAAARKFPLKFRIAELPGMKYRGLSAEWGAGAKAQPIAGFIGRKFVKGTPEIDISKAAFAEYTPKTSTATKIIKSNIAKAYGMEAPKYTSVVEVTEVTGGTGSRFIGEAFPERTKTLSPAGTKEVLAFAKREKAMLYGSYTAEPQLKGTLGRVPGDIDVQMKLNTDIVAKKAQELAKRLEMTEGKGRVRISAHRPMLIETMGKRGEFHHAVDIHAIDEASDSLSAVMEGAMGFRYGRKAKVAGQEVMALSEFGIRKGVSSAILRKGKIAPAAHRIKDVGDFAAAQETLIESEAMGVYGKLRKGRIAKAEKGLAAFKKAWGIEGKPKPVRFKAELYKPSQSGASALKSMGIYVASARAPSPGARSARASSPASMLRSMGIYTSASVPSPKALSLGISPSGRSPSAKLASYGIYSPKITKPVSYISRGRPSPGSGYPSPPVIPKPPPAALPIIFSPGRPYGKGGGYLRRQPKGKGEAKAAPGYHAYTKVLVNPRTKRGRTKRITDKPMDFYGAVSAGASYVDNSPAGSFTVRKAKRAAQAQGVDLWNAGLSRKFRKRKLKTTFRAAEKTPYLMDTPGEASFYHAESKSGRKRAKLRRSGKIDIRRAL